MGDSAMPQLTLSLGRSNYSALFLIFPFSVATQDEDSDRVFGSPRGRYPYLFYKDLNIPYFIAIIRYFLGSLFNLLA